MNILIKCVGLVVLLVHIQLHSRKLYEQYTLVAKLKLASQSFSEAHVLQGNYNRVSNDYNSGMSFEGKKQTSWTTFNKDLPCFVKLPEHPREVWPGKVITHPQVMKCETVCTGAYAKARAKRYLYHHMVTPCSNTSSKKLGHVETKVYSLLLYWHWPTTHTHTFLAFLRYE